MDKRTIANLEVKKSLADALFALVDEKGVGSVGVIELVARAGVSRSSFYRNFSSIDDVLVYGNHLLVDEYHRESPYEAVDFTDVACITWNLEFWKANAKRIIALNHSGLSHVSFQQIIEASMNDSEGEDTEERALFERRFALGAFYTIAIDWIERGAPGSSEELARRYCSVLTSGVST